MNDGFCPDCAWLLDERDRQKRALQNVRDLVKSQEEEICRVSSEIAKLRCGVAADSRDLEEARCWVRSQVELGAALPPLEVAFMAGRRSMRDEIAASREGP